MSLKLIQEYHSRVEEILQYGGSHNETAIRPAFQKLIEQYCADKKIELILELEYRTAHGTIVNPDGTLKDAFRQDWGYWESKDKKDSLDQQEVFTELKFYINKKTSLIEKFSFTDMNGNENTFELSNIKLNPKMGNKLFTLEVPKGTEFIKY